MTAVKYALFAVIFALVCTVFEYHKTDDAASKEFATKVLELVNRQEKPTRLRRFVFAKWNVPCATYIKRMPHAVLYQGKNRVTNDWQEILEILGNGAR